MPMGGSGGDGGASRIEAQRQQRLNSGMTAIDSAFKGFDSGFFSRRAEDYRNFAIPQAQKQYDQTRKSLAYSLARNGLENSGAAVNENQALQDTRNQKLSDIVNEGQNQSNELRGQVATQKSNLVNQLVSSSNPALAREGAAAATAGLGAPSAFQPIGQLFGDFSQMYLNNQLARTYSNAASDTNWGNLLAAK